MKKEFPGYFSSIEANKKLWDECFFVFDANILLNLYRYSDATRDSFLETLESLKDRVWIPHQVALEYLNNRVKVILDQGIEYKNTIGDISKLKEKLENSKAHPFIKEDTLEGVSLSLEKAIAELEENKQKYEDRITEDEIKDSVAEIFKGRIGEEIERKELESILVEGEARYKEKTPPGYSDINKQGQDESFAGKTRPYGDLIIWKSLLNKAGEKNQSVIFVTGDHKEDWWLKGGGRTLGPRPELVKEFKASTNKEFHMYLPERFLEFAKQRIKSRAPKEVLDEIRTTRALDLNKEYLDEFSVKNYEKVFKKVYHIESSKQMESMIERLNIKTRIKGLKYQLEASRETEKHLREKIGQLTMDFSFQLSTREGQSDKEVSISLSKISKEIARTEAALTEHVVENAKLVEEIESLKIYLGDE